MKSNANRQAKDVAEKSSSKRVENVLLDVGLSRPAPNDKNPFSRKANQIEPPHTPPKSPSTSIQLAFPPLTRLILFSDSASLST